MAQSADNRTLLRILQQHPGVTIHNAKRGGHKKIYLNGQMVTSLPNSSSHRRGHLNMLAQLRRAGINV